MCPTLPFFNFVFTSFERLTSSIPQGFFKTIKGSYVISHACISLGMGGLPSKADGKGSKTNNSSPSSWGSLLPPTLPLKFFGLSLDSTSLDPSYISIHLSTWDYKSWIWVQYYINLGCKTLVKPSFVMM